MEAVELLFESGPPWGVVCELARAPEGWTCVLFRSGAGAAPAAAEEPWQAQLARGAARRLGRSARAAVHCRVSLGSAERGPGRDRLEAVAARLVRRAAAALELGRLRASLADPKGWLQRIASGRAAVARRIEVFRSIPFEQLERALGEAAARTHARHFRGVVRLFAPLYLSNACQNDCSYCGFQRSARFARTHLSAQCAVDQAQLLATRGHRSLDLVTGEVPTDAIVEHVAGIVRRILGETPIARIHLNLGALGAAHYRTLRAAGALGYHLYQETYDPGAYFRAHRSGPKRDMANRLDAPRRALEAGFKALGLGVLLGLGPVRDDLAALVCHARLLERAFPRARLGFSLPRWRPAQTAPGPAPRAVPDGELCALFLFLRLEFPRAHLTLTTREGAELRDRLLPLGVTKLSAGVSTSPGGYTRAAGVEQFSIRDRSSLRDVARRVRAAGLTPAYE